MAASSDEGRSMILWDGTSQDDRLLSALKPDFFHVDETRFEDYLAMAARYAGLLEFRGLDNRPSGDWKTFFESDETCILASLLATNLELIEAEFLRCLAVSGRYTHLLNDERVDMGVFVALDLARQVDMWHTRLSVLSSPEATRAYEKISGLIEHTLSGEFLRLCTFIEDSAGFSKGEVTIPELADIWRKPKRLSGQSGESFPEDAWQFLKANFYSFRNAILHLQEWARDSLSVSLQRGDHDPAIGLFIAFLKLFERVQGRLDDFTQRHMDFYYEDVLKMRRYDYVPDSVHLVFSPDKAGREVLIARGTGFKAGMDENQNELIYQADSDLLVTDARVCALYTLNFARDPLRFPEKALVDRPGSDGIAKTYATSAQLNHMPADNRLIDNGSARGVPLLGAARRSQITLRSRDADIGFAVASSVLLMKQGDRDVVMSLKFNADETGSDLLAAFTHRLFEISSKNENGMLSGSAGSMPEYSQTSLKDAFFKAFRHMFNIAFTGEQGWLEIGEYFPVSGLVAPGACKDNVLKIRIHLPDSAGAIVPYSRALHGDAFDTNLPVARVYLNPDAYFYPYSLLRRLEIREVGIEVDVKGCTDMLIYNQQGQLGANVQFNPFGSMPSPGDYLIVGNYEAARKKLTDFEVKIEWGGLPVEMNGFEEYYRAYGLPVDNSVFKVKLAVLRGGRWAPVAEDEQPELRLFESADADEDSKTNQVDKVRRISFAGLCKSSKPLENVSEEGYAYSPRMKNGFFRLVLTNPPFAFGHKLYPSVLSKAMMDKAKLSGFGLFKWLQRAKRSRLVRRALPRQPAVPRKYKRFMRYTRIKVLPQQPKLPVESGLPSEPYTPLIRSISVNYKAISSINLENVASSEEGLQSAELYHLHPFGMAALYTGMRAKNHLVPQFEEDGNLFIGISATRLSGMLTLFFQLLEDSMPEASDVAFKFSWHYLAGKRWKMLDQSCVVSDTTNGFLSSGIVTLDIPPDIERGGSIMPGDLYWLRLSADGSHLHTLCSLYEIHAQTVKASWAWQDGNSPAHLETKLPAGSITEAKFSIPGIQGIRQVMDSFGGAAQESREQRMVRVSERLRHKNRAVTPWDYERLILQYFPGIYKVKCFPCLSGRAEDNGKARPGELLLVLIPVLHESDSMNMHPMVNALVLKEVREFVAGLASSFVDIHVRNPVYEQIQVRCKVRLRKDPGRKLKHNELNQKIVDYLSPWNASGLTARFGWQVRCNDVHSYIQGLDFVESISGLSMLHIVEEDNHLYRLGDTARKSPDGMSATDIKATHPWSIAIPVRQHLIEIVDDKRAWPPEATGVSRLSIGSTFILSRGET